MRKIGIYIVDDHQIIIDGLKLMLFNSAFEIVGESNSATRALTEITLLNPDIVITDISMPEMSGLELVRRLKSQNPMIKILVLSMFENPAILKDLLLSDISGFVLKDKGQDELVCAVNQISKGQCYFSIEVMKYIVEIKTQSDNRLTLREIEIVKLLDEGLSSNRIAEALFISTNTIETHRRNILKKTNTHSVTELLRYTKDNKLI